MTPPPAAPAAVATPGPAAAPLSAAAAPARAGPPLWLLVLITFSGTVAMHIFTPALPQAAASLHATAAAMQMTVSIYILGLAVGQPIYGPLSDCYGRRPVLMAGMALYALGGVLAMLAPTVHLLVAARFLQALGGCAGLTLGRAIVRDTSGVSQSVRRLALMNLVMTVGPGLAPLLGQTVAGLFGWRLIFVLLVALGLLNLALSWRILPETGRPTGRLTVATLRRDYARLLRSRAFLGYAIGGGCVTTSIYAFMATAPFIFVDEMHRPAHEVAVYLGLTVLGSAGGSLVASRLIGRMSAERLLMVANAVLLASVATLLGTALLGRPSWQLMLGAMMVFGLGCGMSGPAALTKSISVDPALVGSASGLYGATQMVVGALCTSAAGWGDDPALAVAAVLTAAVLLGQVMFRMAVKAEAAGAPRRAA